MVDPGRVRALLDRLSEETTHLRRQAASEGLRAPSDFADVFAVLGENEFVSEDMVRLLQNMARFRNLLVHGYLRVDDQKVVEILRSRLGDFDEFRAAIARKVIDQ